MNHSPHLNPDPRLIGRIAEEVARIDLQEGEDPDRGAGIVAVFPMPNGGDIVFRFKDGIALATMNPNLSTLLASLTQEQVGDFDVVQVGFTEQAADTPERFEALLSSLDIPPTEYLPAVVPAAPQYLDITEQVLRSAKPKPSALKTALAFMVGTIFGAVAYSVGEQLSDETWKE